MHIVKISELLVVNIATVCLEVNCFQLDWFFFWFWFTFKYINCESVVMVTKGSSSVFHKCRTGTLIATIYEKSRYQPKLVGERVDSNVHQNRLNILSPNKTKENTENIKFNWLIDYHHNKITKHAINHSQVTFLPPTMLRMLEWKFKNQQQGNSHPNLSKHPPNWPTFLEQLFSHDEDNFV